MEAIENRALASFHPRPNVFLRYIDDCFCIVKKDALAAFTRHINSMEKAIQFTVEEEVGNQLPFLDVLVERVGHNLSFRVFRKSTHTGRCFFMDDASEAVVIKSHLSPVFTLQGLSHTTGVATGRLQGAKEGLNLERNSPLLQTEGNHLRLTGGRRNKVDQRDGRFVLGWMT
ncbi:uncharacterized protein LOC144102794 [Amblyomma americanum]